jgi:hypothetical protein
MSKASPDQRPYSPVGQLLPGLAATGAAALRPLVDIQLSVSGTAVERGGEDQAAVDAFSAEAIDRSREAEARHRRARRSAKTRGSRRLFD